MPVCIDHARPTRRSSRPLRARDHWHFSSLCGALAAAERQSDRRLMLQASQIFPGNSD